MTQEDLEQKNLAELYREVFGDDNEQLVQEDSYYSLAQPHLYKDIDSRASSHSFLMQE